MMNVMTGELRRYEIEEGSELAEDNRFSVSWQRLEVRQEAADFGGCRRTRGQWVDTAKGYASSD